MINSKYHFVFALSPLDSLNLHILDDFPIL